tara:strand:+ start:173 stop:367 length:195 start_codon:yes stop_codon:yes gene_type:complete
VRLPKKIRNKKMDLNKDIVNFKDPELRKKVDRIQYEREMVSIAVILFIEKITNFFGLSKSEFER